MKLYITTISFSVLVNRRQQGGRVQPQRGVRQGCPLALLFHVGSGHSSVLHNKALLKGLIIRISSGRIPRRCSPATICRRYHLLQSGLRVNGSHPKHHDGNFLQFLRSPSEQSQIHFRGIWVIDGRDDSLCGHSRDVDPCAPHTVLGYAIVREVAPSSGLATVVGHGGCTIKGLAGAASIAWGTPSSEEAVLSAIPTYFMSVFRMLAGMRRRLEGAIRHFFWSGSGPVVMRGGALVAWTTVCRPLSQGGLGIHHIQHTSTALLAKWVYRVMQASGDILSQVIREAYGQSLD